MADDEWSTDANEAIQISICQAGAEGPTEISSFNPEYTERYFGKDQSIFGYKDLALQFRFAAHDLFPNFQYTFTKKFPNVKESKAVDIVSKFKDDLVPYGFNKPESFDKRLQDPAKAASFKPPGELVDSYTVKGRNYEIWAGELTDTAVQKIIERIQILIPFFIDGGLLLPVDDPEWTLARWRVWFIYEKLSSPSEAGTSPYSIVGYSTAYRFLTYQPSTSPHFTSSTSLKTSPFPPTEPLSISSLPNRSRISQFLILPPHQGAGHGSHLYAAAIKSFLADPACIEITVEDPNEQFDDLRDMCDFARLTANGTFEQINLNTDVDAKLTARRPRARLPTAKLINSALLAKLRTENKLAPRQFSRLIELYLLSQIPASNREPARLIRKGAASNRDDRAFYYWRLLVKQRVYKQHRDVLAQMELGERVEKLEETLEVQWRDYERLLLKMGEKAAKEGFADEQDGDGAGEPMDLATDGTADAASGGRAKRKVIDDDEDEEAAADVGEGQMAAKKPKTGEE